MRAAQFTLTASIKFRCQCQYFTIMFCIVLFSFFFLLAILFFSQFTYAACVFFFFCIAMSSMCFCCLQALQILFFIVNHMLRAFVALLCLNGVCCLWQSVLGSFFMILFFCSLLYCALFAFLQGQCRNCTTTGDISDCVGNCSIIILRPLLLALKICLQLVRVILLAHAFQVHPLLDLSTSANSTYSCLVFHVFPAGTLCNILYSFV